MKKSLFACAICLQALLGYLPLFAQGTSAVFYRPWIVKTNIYGPFSLFFEGPITSQKSWQLSLQRINFAFLGPTHKFFSLTAEMKFYLSESPSSAHSPYFLGWYLSPYLKYRHVGQVNYSGLFSGGTRLSEVSYLIICWVMEVLQGCS